MIKFINDRPRFIKLESQGNPHDASLNVKYNLYLRILG